MFLVPRSRDRSPANDHLESSGLDLARTEVVQDEHAQRCTAGELQQDRSFTETMMGGGPRDHVMTCNVTRGRVVCPYLIHPYFKELCTKARVSDKEHTTRKR